MFCGKYLILLYSNIIFQQYILAIGLPFKCRINNVKNAPNLVAQLSMTVVYDILFICILVIVDENIQVSFITLYVNVSTFSKF